jgi:transcriptional regulator with XRE-family HTH domain
MADYKGILHEVVIEKREQFAARFRYWLNSTEFQGRGTRTKIAAFCGANINTVHSWEKMRAFPNNEHIECLAAFFGESVETFLGADLWTYYKLSEQRKKEAEKKRKRKEDKE